MVLPGYPADRVSPFPLPYRGITPIDFTRYSRHRPRSEAQSNTSGETQGGHQRPQLPSPHTALNVAIITGPAARHDRRLFITAYSGASKASPPSATTSTVRHHVAKPRVRSLNPPANINDVPRASARPRYPPAAAISPGWLARAICVNRTPAEDFQPASPAKYRFAPDGFWRCHLARTEGTEAMRERRLSRRERIPPHTCSPWVSPPVTVVSEQ